MIRREIILNDYEAKCSSYLHGRQSLMQVCVDPSCHSQPNYICVDCASQLHVEHTPILSSEEFVIKTNEKHRSVQELVIELEAQVGNFKQQASKVRKQFSGEIDKLKNTALKQLDTIQEVVFNYTDKIESHVQKMVGEQIKAVKALTNPLRCQKISQLNQDSLRHLIYVLWHQGLDSNLRNIDGSLQTFFSPYAKELTLQAVRLNDDMNDFFSKYKTKIYEYSKDKFETLTSTVKTGGVSEEKKVENEQNYLLIERDKLNKQMKDHIITIKRELQRLKAYYGYYYLNSNYAKYNELPLNRQGKAKVLNDKLEKVIQRLYEIGYRDDYKNDYIWVEFIR